MFTYSAHIQTLLRGHKYALFIFRSSACWQLRKSVGGIWGRVLTESCALVERKIEFIVGEF